MGPRRTSQRLIPQISYHHLAVRSPDEVKQSARQCKAVQGSASPTCGHKARSNSPSRHTVGDWTAMSRLHLGMGLRPAQRAANRRVRFRVYRYRCTQDGRERDRVDDAVPTGATQADGEDMAAMHTSAGAKGRRCLARLPHHTRRIIMLPRRQWSARWRRHYARA